MSKILLVFLRNGPQILSYKKISVRSKKARFLFNEITLKNNKCGKTSTHTFEQHCNSVNVV